jgi:hypothetical protein
LKQIQDNLQPSSPGGVTGGGVATGSESSSGHVDDLLASDGGVVGDAIAVAATGEKIGGDLRTWCLGPGIQRYASVKNEKKKKKKEK